MCDICDHWLLLSTSLQCLNVVYRCYISLYNVGRQGGCILPREWETYAVVLIMPWMSVTSAGLSSTDTQTKALTMLLLTELQLYFLRQAAPRTETVRGNGITSSPQIWLLLYAYFLLKVNLVYCKMLCFDNVFTELIIVHGKQVITSMKDLCFHLFIFPTMWIMSLLFAR